MSEKDVETGSIRSLPETHRYEDPSSKLWSAYVAEANVYDRALVESWKGDMDGILFFAGLFSASVTAFIVESYKMLKPDSGDMTVTLLMQISRQLNTSSNGLHTEDMGRPTLGKFQATSSAIRVNAFWFLSLCFGLACALAATLVEQWARNYMQGIERRPAPHKKARIRAFLYEGVESYGMSNVVEGIPTLLHIAVFLFFAGLVEFLFPIHPGIAWLVLVIVFVCAGLYGVITILPTIHRQCPYRTPLSGICWRVFQALGLIRYIDTNGEYARIEGSIAQGQEILATRILPGQYQRDLRALKWTVEMLTDDNEFEAFLEGVRIYLSDPTSPVIRDLMLDPDINLIDRIARLLATCTQSGALPEDSRCRRALTSMETVCALVKVVDTVRWTSKWTSLDSFGIILGQSLKRLERDNSAAISDIAAVTIKCVVDKLHQDIITIIQRRDLWNISDKPSTFIWNSTNAALNTLNSMGALDSIIEMIPGLMISIPSSCVIAEHSVLLCIALNCGLSHIPTLLKTCSQLGASGSVRRVRAIACMRAICHAAAVFQAWNVSTSRSLAAIKKDIILDIVPYVTLTAARAACHLQCDIVDTMGGISAHRTNGKAGKLPSGLTSRVAQCYGAITELGLLDPCHDGDAGSDVNLLQHMQLGIITDLPELHEQDLWQKLLQQSVEEAERQLELIPLEEQKSLDNFELRTSAFKIHPPQPIPRHLKLIVNRGHIAVLIHLLQTMAHSPSFYTSDEVDFALETLEFVTSNLSARFSSPPVQKLLVQLIGEIIEKISLPDYSKLPHELKWRTVDPLLAMIGTIGDADSIADAKKLMHHYLGTVQFGEAATAALQKLEDTLPLALLSE